jgi:glutathione peroxidase
MFSKISVKGKNIHPLYQYLTSHKDNGEFGNSITWNFNKFLIDKHGKTIAYFGSKVEPLDPQMITAVEKALKE